ncbi:44527_t:CDS:2, partial [Gigaspora margarita]
SLLDENYHICDPWVQPNDGCPQPNDGSPHPNDGGSPQYFVYLDKEKKIILLIGNYTVQVWYERENKKRSLEFISVINRDDHERCINRIYKKFKFLPHFKDSQSIEIEGDNYVIDAVNEACNMLKYLYQMREEYDKHDVLITYEIRYLKYKEITKQTRTIIVRFIQLYPIVWQLLDIRFDLLSIPIDAKESINNVDDVDDINDFNDSEKNRIFKTLDDIVSKLDQLSRIKPVQNSLLHKRSLHMPQYNSWEGGKNVIHKVLLDNNPIFLGYFLEYYSNKAAEEIGWMITISEFLPKLYDKDNKNHGFYKSYAQLLFYKRCFCSKGLDIPFFKFIKILPSITGNNSLEVFIPVTQLIPKDCNLEINKIKIPDIQMVPLQIKRYYWKKEEINT